MHIKAFPGVFSGDYIVQIANDGISVIVEIDNIPSKRKEIAQKFIAAAEQLLEGLEE